MKDPDDLVPRQGRLVGSTPDHHTALWYAMDARDWTSPAERAKKRKAGKQQRAARRRNRK